MEFSQQVSRGHVVPLLPTLSPVGLPSPFDVSCNLRPPPPPPPSDFRPGPSSIAIISLQVNLIICVPPGCWEFPAAFLTCLFEGLGVISDLTDASIKYDCGHM